MLNKLLFYCWAYWKLRDGRIDRIIRIKGWRTALVQYKITRNRATVAPLIFNRW